MKVKIHRRNFAYHMQYTDTYGERYEFDIGCVGDPVVEYILCSLVFILYDKTGPGRITWFNSLEYDGGIAVLSFEGSPPTSIGLADDANPKRRIFLSAISALLELAELQQAQPVQ